MNLNFDLQLQLVEYLYSTNILAWLKLLEITGFNKISSKNFYISYLYLLRKHRYILSPYELYRLVDLIKNGVNINALDSRHKWTPLMYASEKGHDMMVQYLVSRGADISAKKNLAIKLAAENGYVNIVRYLLPRISNMQDINQRLISKAIIKSKRLNILKQYVKQGIDINTLNTMIEYSAKYGNLESLKYLIQQYNTLITRSIYSEALMEAVRNGQLEIVKYLIEQLNINFTQNDYNRILKISRGGLVSKHFNGVEIIKYLVRHGANPNILSAEVRRKIGL